MRLPIATVCFLLALAAAAPDKAFWGVPPPADCERLALFTAAPGANRDHQRPFSQYVSSPGTIRFVKSSCAVESSYFASASRMYTFWSGPYA